MKKQISSYGIYGISVMQFPSGRFGFIGSVPVWLRDANGNPFNSFVTMEQAEQFYINKKQDMDFQKKIQRAFNKWNTLSEAARNEFDHKKANAAYDKLEAMFNNKEEFKKYWESKINYNIVIPARHTN